MGSISVSNQRPPRSLGTTSNWKRPPGNMKSKLFLPMPLQSPWQHVQIRNKPASEQYRVWAQKYGPVFQIYFGNTPVVVINSTVAAKEVFLSQVSATNSRPDLAFFHQQAASSAALSIGMSPWDDSCKRKRKVAATSLNRSRTVGYHPVLFSN